MFDIIHKKGVSCLYNFFVEQESRSGSYFYITGKDHNHIKNVLRMKEKERFLVSCNNISSLCELCEINETQAVAEIIEENFQNTDLPVKIYLFEGLPKSDKMELIIQKTVELGVHGVVPCEMKRSVVKLDDKKKKSKAQRWQAIAESAAKQSKRSFIPEVHDVLSFKDAVDFAQTLDLVLVPYECKDGMESTKRALSEIKENMSIGIFVGPEGGFEESEIAELSAIGGKTISLGKRILRTETAAICAVSMCMLYCEMDLNGDDND